MSGRPLLFPDGRQISVLVSAEDYRALSTLVKKTRVIEPNFGLGDLLRGYIRRCLETPKRAHTFDPKHTRIRRLHAIARAARGLAKELETVEQPKSQSRTRFKVSAAAPR